MMKIFARLLVLCLAGPLFAAAVEIDDDVAALQRDWETIRYRTPASEREQRFESLATRAHAASERSPVRAEALVWEGIILSSWASEKGGLGALRLARQAKTVYEQAIDIDGTALHGSAYNSLGVLYFKVPGWPLGFGDMARAGVLLRKALEINPNGIDPNFFYAEYLVESGRVDEAVDHLERALRAPARPGREIADAGRREEAQALLARIKSP